MDETRAPLHDAHDPDLPMVVVARKDASGAPPNTARTRMALATALLAALLLATGAIAIIRAASGDTTTVAESAPSNRVLGLGKITPRGSIATVGLPSGSGDAAVTEIVAKVGQRVASGELLAVLDTRALREASVVSARALVAARRATRDQVEHALFASRTEKRAELARAEDAAAAALRESERARVLLEGGALSREAFDARGDAASDAQRALDVARASQLRFGTWRGGTHPDVVLAEANIRSAEADLARARVELEHAEVRSPIAGIVLEIHVEPGERPLQAGLMDIGDLDVMVAEVEVYQSEVPRVRVGAPVVLSAPAFTMPLRGRVVTIGLVVGRQENIDPAPAANTDARVIEVDVELDAASSSLARSFVGLQVDAAIEVGEAP